jgi:hypothetical protein
MKKAFYKRLLAISNQLASNYIKRIRSKSSDFTRQRKISLQDLFLQMIANKGKSQKNELYDYYSEVRASMDVSATAFYNARMKFNPEALLTIMQDLTKEEYENPVDLVTLNGYYVMAVDGSDFLLPNTAEIRDKYGHSINQTEHLGQAISSISTIFDCINKLFLDVSINPYKYSEHSSALNHLATVDRLLPEDTKYLCLFDRGYAGIRIIDRIIENDQKFLIRLPSNSFAREQNQLSLENPDRWIDIKYDRARTNWHRKDFQFCEKLLNTTYHLRFVRVYFEDQKGNEEYSTFITNLPDDEFDTNAIAELYHIRWDIETSYRSLKSQLRVEEFSGNRDILIRQDIYAGAIVYNAVSMSIAENKKHQPAPHERYKYDMQINRNYAIGVLKTDLLKMFVLYRDKKFIKRAQRRFEKNIVKYSCPVRKERSNLRITIGNGKNNHSYRRNY